MIFVAVDRSMIEWTLGVDIVRIYGKLEARTGALTISVLRAVALPADLSGAVTDGPFSFLIKDQLQREIEGFMYLLYLDESGSVADADQRHFVLAGLSVFERSTHWIEQELNQIALRFAPDPNCPYDVELHASPMRNGRSGWRSHSVPSRLQAIRDGLEVVRRHHPRDVRLFAAALNKQNFSGQDIAHEAFTQVCSRFDLFLMRLYQGKGDKQRGMIIFDKSNTEARIQALARDFKYSGHQYGMIRNYAEVPAFLDSKASRLIQLADLVAFAVFRHYEHNDSQFFEIIEKCFDSDGGVVHGLYHR